MLTKEFWCGAVVWAPAGRVITGVSGTWTIPNAQVPGASYILTPWIGINGFAVPAGTSFIQAGTQTEEKDRKVRTFAWYQWWSSSQVLLETFGVRPGDYVNCAITIESPTRVEIAFHNMTTGQKLGPQTVTKPGDVGRLEARNAQWIVETPIRWPGGPPADLPPYGALYFNDCVASTNKFGELLTAGEGTLYKWSRAKQPEQSVPSMRNGQLMKVEYLWNRGSLRLLYKSVDNHIRELWSEREGWHVDDLTAAASAPSAAANSPVVGYDFGNAHVIYRGVDHHILELWRDSVGWHLNDLMWAASAPVAAENSPLAAYVSGKTQRVLYLSSDNHVRELWWEPRGWHVDDLTAAASAPSAAANSPVVGYDFGNAHVIYRGVDHHILELWRDSVGWHLNDLMWAASAPDAAPDSPLVGHVMDKTQRVMYRGKDSHIKELWWNPEGWHLNDLMSWAAAPNAGPNSPIGGYVQSFGV
jgi:hypothetical protein